MGDRNDEPLTKGQAGCLIIAIGLIVLVFGGMVYAGVTQPPSPKDLCVSALPVSTIVTSTEIPNGNILCKIIDADSVERSVWLNGDGELLELQRVPGHRELIR